MRMLEKITQRLELTTISATQWISGFVGIICIRFFLEQFSVPSSSGIIASDSFSLIHYGLFYLSALIGLMCIVDFFTKKGRVLGGVMLAALPAIWIAPILDLILSAGSGFSMTYVFAGLSELIFNFLTFFGPKLSPGITPGIRIEIIIILCLLWWYVRETTSSRLKAFFTTFISYVFIFCILSVPSIVYAVALLFSNTASYPHSIAMFTEAFTHSSLSHNIIHGTLQFSTETRFFELAFNKFMSQFFLILSSVLAMIFFWRNFSREFKAVFSNSRPERVVHYFILLFLGMSFAYTKGYSQPFAWIDAYGITCLFLSWYAAWMFAVHVNDEADVSIDAVSNTSRPLITGEISPYKMKQIGFLWLGVSLLGSWSAGYYPFFFNLVFTACYFIYSAGFLRLKQIPILSSFLISLACLATVLSGFFFMSINKSFDLFPLLVAVGVVVVYTLGSNVRDLKDVEGDRQGGIYTLPVLLGPIRGPQVIGIMFGASFLLTPLFLSQPALYIASLPAASMGYICTTRKIYKEKYVFYTYFSFVFCILLIYAFII